MTTALHAKALRFDLNYPALNIDIPAGSLSFVLGATGTGKSDLMLTLAGVLQAQAGELRLHDEDPFAGNEKEWLKRRPEIGYVLPSRTLISHLTIVQNIMLPLSYHGLQSADQAQKTAQDMIEWLGITTDTGELPAVCLEAERRLITLGRALVLQPNTVFVDQAFAHLDALSRQHFIAVYSKLLSELKLTLILASKDLLAVESLSEVVKSPQRFIFLANANILCFDSWTALINSGHQEIQNYLKLHLPERFNNTQLRHN